MNLANTGTGRRPQDEDPTTALRGSRAGLVRALIALVLVLGLVGSACGGDDDSASTSTDDSSADAGEATGDITVSAAASLQESFTQIADDFEAANPGTSVTINFGSSGDLATQIESGAPVDVAAFAAEANMEMLADDDLLDGPVEIFATNQLVIVTKPGNPEGITELSDLATVAEEGGTVSLCADTAPCGTYAAEILEQADVSIPDDRVTLGQDVRATLSAVTDGDADAGIVYVTDAAAVGDAVDTVTIPEDQNAVARYPIAVVGATEDAEVSQAFMEHVLDEQAQTTLRDAGFGAP